MPGHVVDGPRQGSHKAHAGRITAPTDWYGDGQAGRAGHQPRSTLRFVPIPAWLTRFRAQRPSLRSVSVSRRDYAERSRPCWGESTRCVGSTPRSPPKWMVSALSPIASWPTRFSRAGSVDSTVGGRAVGQPRSTWGSAFPGGRAGLTPQAVHGDDRPGPPRPPDVPGRAPGPGSEPSMPGDALDARGDPEARADAVGAVIRRPRTVAVPGLVRNAAARSKSPAPGVPGAGPVPMTLRRSSAGSHAGCPPDPAS